MARWQRLLVAGPGAGSPFFALYAVPDLVEAAVRSGRRDAAEGPLAAFEQLAAVAAGAELPAQLARCRGLLGPDETELFLSRRTIDYHLRNVFVKLGVSSRAELIRLALTDR